MYNKLRKILFHIDTDVRLKNNLLTKDPDNTYKKLNYLYSLGCVLKNPTLLFPWLKKSLFWFLFDAEPSTVVGSELDETTSWEHAAWNIWRVHKDWLQSILYVGVFYLAFTIIFAEGYQIPSGSMEPTFHGDPNIVKGDRVFAWKGISAWDEFKRGDIIIFISVEDQKTFIVKRLVGLPGDKVQIKQGKIFINDEPLNDGEFKNLTYYLPIFYTNENNELVFSSSSAVPPIPHVKTIYSQRPTGKYLQCFGQNPIIVPKDCYFVLGDNSKHSNDSRYWGWVPKCNVLGKATMIFWPLNRCRLL